MDLKAKKPPLDKKKSASHRDTSVTILTPSCYFKGKLYCKGSSRIGGKIEGELVSEGLLIIEEEALIEAKVYAEEVIVQGIIKGSLRATERVELASSCRFEGELYAQSLVVHEGAHIDGKVSMVMEEESQLEPVIDNIQNQDFAGQKVDLQIAPNF